VENFLETTKIIESPTSYLEWSAYVTIGSVLRANVYIDLPSRRTKITPNLYVLLVGDSGATRKSTPLKLCNFLVKAANNTKIVEGRASIQAVLKELAEVRRTDKVMISDAAALLYSEEFAAFLVKDPATSGILTDIYDYKEETDVILKGEGSIKLKKLSVTLFAATNVAFLKDMFTKTDLEGGLVARTILIMETKARHKALGLRDTATDEDFTPLIQHLQYLAKLKGPVRFTDEGIQYLEEWYDNTDASVNESRTGFEHRIPAHAEKLAMILAASEPGWDLSIHKHHCIKALDKILALRRNYHNIMSAATTDFNSTRQAIKDITHILFTFPDLPLTRQILFQKLHGNIDAETFDKAIATLDQAGFITCGGTTTPVYRLSPKGREIILGETKNGGGR